MTPTFRSVGSLVACLGLSVLVVGSASAQTDSQIGLWKLNVAKSKYDPGPPPKSATTRIEAAGTGVKVTVDQVMADGSTRHWGFTGSYDGKDVPVTGNNPDADTVARTRVNPSTVQMVLKKRGKVTTTLTSTVSSDGKTRTVTTKGISASNQQVNNVAVYERQ